APAAFSATNDRAGCDAITHFESFHSFAKRDDSPRHLMADNYWGPHTRHRVCLAGRDIERTSHVLVQVRTADSAPGHLNLYLSACRWGRIVHLLHSHVLPSMPYCCFHFGPPELIRYVENCGSPLLQGRRKGQGQRAGLSSFAFFGGAAHQRISNP